MRVKDIASDSIHVKIPPWDSQYYQPVFYLNSERMSLAVPIIIALSRS